MSYTTQNITADLANSAQLKQQGDSSYPTGNTADNVYTLNGYTTLDVGQRYDGSRYYDRYRWFLKFDLPAHFMSVNSPLYFDMDSIYADTAFILQMRNSSAATPPVVGDWPNYGASVLSSIASGNLVTGWNHLTVPASSLASILKLALVTDREAAGTQPTNNERATLYASSNSPYIVVQVPLASKAPTDLALIPISDGQHTQTSFKYNAAGTNGNTNCTYIRIQISDISDFSNILYDTGQVVQSPTADGSTITAILDWFPSDAKAYYYRIATWDDDNKDMSAEWGTKSFTVGYPTISELNHTHNKEHYAFTAEVQDSYTKPPVVSCVIDNNAKLMELIKREYRSKTIVSSWNYRRSVTIDHTKIDENLTDFPTLVKLDNSNFDFSKAKSDGTDIKFTDMDGNLLDFERVSYDSTAQTAEFWVKIPSVSSSADTEFYMYYGNSGASDQQNPTAVWDSNYNFVSHLNNNPDNSHIKDSTANGNNGTKVGAGEPAETDGKTGKAQSFDGSNDLITLPPIKPVQNITVEAIVFLDNNFTTNNNYFLTWDGGNHGWSLIFYNYSGYGYTYALTTVDNGALGVVSGDLTTGAYYYLTLTYDGSTVRGYRNGVEIGNTAATGNIDYGSLANWYMGGYNGGSDFMKGIVDETRISNIVRSPAWIKATYYTEYNALLSYNSEETEPFSTGEYEYFYTYKTEYALERGKHEYHVEVGNVWTVLIGDTRHLEAQYTLDGHPEIKVFSGNRLISNSNAVITENMIPDVDSLEFDTEEDLREGVGDLSVYFTGNELKSYTMHIVNIRKIAGGWHIKAEEKAREDLKQVVSFSSQAIESASIVQSILPDYTIRGAGNLTEIIYLQAFQNERISDILQRILLINGAAATARNKHLYIYPQNGDAKLALHANDPDTKYSADFHIINKLREYFVKRQYPVPKNALTNYDASNWSGTISDEQQTNNGVLPGSPYCLKGTGTIARTVDFAFTDYDQMHLGFSPNSDNTLEIRLETDASNYRKYVRTFSGQRGSGFVLMGDSANAVVTKDITFTGTKYIHLVQGRTSQACTAKIELKKSGLVVASSEWMSTEGDGFFGQYFDNVECDTITISFTNLYIVGNGYGMNCYNLQIEEHKQVYETTGTHIAVHWKQKYVGSGKVNVSKQYIYKGDSATVNGTLSLGAVPALTGNQRYALNLGKCRITIAYRETASNHGVLYKSIPLNLTAHVEGGVLKAEISGVISNSQYYEIIVPAYDVDYNFIYLIEQTVTEGTWVWKYANYEWAASYNLFDYAVIPLSAFSAVGSPTNQVNTIRLIITGDVYYDKIYFIATNPSPQYVEVKNEDSINNHWLSFNSRTTDGWSSKESAQAFAQAFVDKFGEPGQSYKKNVGFWTDINIGDIVDCDGTTMQVYCIVYNPGKGTKQIMVGRKITDTLEFLKQASAKIQALEKNIM